MTLTAKSADLRANIAKALCLITEKKRTIDWILTHHPDWTAQPIQRELLYGCARHYLEVQSTIDPLLKKPLRDKDQDLYHLLIVGAYQLLYLNIPQHAVINETVNATKKLHKPWARGLVNGVLRTVSRNNAQPKLEEPYFGHPPWLAKQIQQTYKNSANDILVANTKRAPMTLRVNQTKISVCDYQTLLNHNKISHQIGALPQSIILDQPMHSQELPGWHEGWVAVQDLGAQFAAILLDQHTNEPNRILDACAAPGGKLSHLLELKQNIIQSQPTNVTAIDHSPARISQTQQILARLGHDLALRSGDATDLTWWDGKPYSAILLDAPCSGTGTIRRHPDIKMLLNAKSIDELQELQLKMLNNLWQTLAPQGTLLYCTCSLLDAENDGVISEFLTQHGDASYTSIELPTGSKRKHGWQLLPTDPHTDGFYFALVHKKGGLER